MSAFSWPISCRTWPLPTTANGRWPASTSTWLPGWRRSSASKWSPPSWHWVPVNRFPAFRACSRRSNYAAGSLGGAADSDEPEEVDPALAQARQQLEDNDLGAALDSYQAILDADPNHAEAKGAVRQIVFLMRATAQSPDAVGVADAAPDDIEAAFAAADVQILSQDVEGAFGRLVGLVRRTAGDERTSVRTRLIELFELFDPADPEVVAGRRNLANALY